MEKLTLNVLQRLIRILFPVIPKRLSLRVTSPVRGNSECAGILETMKHMSNSLLGALLSYCANIYSVFVDRNIDLEPLWVSNSFYYNVYVFLFNLVHHLQCNLPIVSCLALQSNPVILLE